MQTASVLELQPATHLELFYNHTHLSRLLISKRICLDTHMERMGKALSSSPTEALSAVITYLATQGAICCYHKADYLTPTAGCLQLCDFFLPNAHTAICGEMLPSWHRLKSVCVLCGCLRLAECLAALPGSSSLAGGWVGVDVEWKAGRMQR